MTFEETINAFGTIEWVVIAAAALLFILGLAKVGKTKQVGKTLKWVGGVGLVLFLVLPFMGFNLLGGLNLGETFTVVDDTSGQQQPGTTLCAIEDTTVTLSSINAYTEGAAGGTHRYRVNSGPALTVSDAGTFTASPGNTLSILYGNESDGTYFGSVANVVVPCRGTYNPAEDSTAYKRYQNGTLAIRVFNEEGNLIDTAGENETLANGDIVSLKTELQGTFQRGFPYGGIVVAEYNKTTVDDVQVQLGGSQTGTPSIYAITLGTDAQTKTFTVPAMLSNQLISGSVVIDADDTNNPPDAGSDVVLTFYPYDYFINDDTGGSFSGPAAEDEDSVQTFGHSTAFTINID